MSLLLKSIAHSYLKRGWQVYSNELDTFERIPSNWIGPKPDLVILRGNTVGAVCLETSSSLNNVHVTERWRTTIDKNKAELTIVVRDPASMDRVKTLAYSAGIAATVRMMKKTHRHSSGSKRTGWRDSKMDWLIIVSVIIVLLAFSVMFIPGFLSKFKMRVFYQPYDRERQEQIIKDREREDTGKSESEKNARRRQDAKMKKEYDKLKEQYNDVK